VSWYSNGMLRLFQLLLCVCVMYGCGIRAPITQFKSATITQSTPVAIVLNAEFEISNTNDEPLQLKYYEYSVFVDGRTVYHGSASAEQTVPRWSTIQSSIPIVIRRDDLHANDLITWQLSGTLSYIPPKAIAETLLNRGIWKPTTPVHAHGSFETPRIN